MGPGHASRRTHEAHDHPLRNVLALMSNESRKMGKQRVQSLPVVDDDGAPGEKEILGKYDSPGAR